MAQSDERHSRKRAAEGDPDGAQPLTKRFGRLHLDNVQPSPGARAKYHETPTSLSNSPCPLAQDNESMLLDDTKHTSYIYDLDRELADIDSPPGALVILPLAERMLTVPDSVLSDDSSQGKELVLYSDPSSLSVPKEQDSVRRAIIESRARARAKKIQIQHRPPNGSISNHTSDDTSHDTSVSTPFYSMSHSDPVNVCDDDPMDIDGDL